MWRRATRPLAAPLSRIARAQVSAAALQGGLRAATATVAPLLVAWTTGAPELVWAALGGWLASLADSGGPYPVRARAMTAFALLGSVSATVAALAGRTPLVAVPLLFVWVFGFALLRAAGDAGATLATLCSSTFVASMALPAATVRGALVRGALVAAGSAGAMALALLAWPVRPYAPARVAVAEVWDALAQYVRSVRDAVAGGAPDADAWLALGRREPARVRTLIERARLAIAQTRRGRLGASRRADALVVLVEGADRVFATVIALSEEVDGALREGRHDASLDDALVALASVLAALSEALPPGRLVAAHPALAPAVDAFDGAAHALADEQAHEQRAARGRETAHGHRARAAGLLVRLADALRAAASVTAAVAAGEEPPSAPGIPVELARGWRGDMLGAWNAIVAALDPESVVMRHALRLAVTTALAAWLGALGHVTRGQWVTTTVLLVLQPYHSDTTRRSMQRAVGTVLGGVVAALLAAVLRDRLLVAAAMFPLSVAAVAVRTVDYGLFTFFLTPLFVLLAEPAVGDWQLAGVRILDTILGGVLAMVASRVLWPSWEHRRLPTTLATMLDAAREYLRVAVSEGPTAPKGAVRGVALARARRRVGLASNEADAAYERFVAEPRGAWGDAEAALALLAYVRRLNGAATALSARGSVGRTDDERALVRTLLDVLDDLARAVGEQRAPAPLPAAVLEATEGGAPGHVGPMVARAARSVAALHAAAARLIG